MDEEPDEVLDKILTGQDFAANIVRAEVSLVQYQNDEPIPYIKRTTSTGIIEIEFTKPMMQPEIDLDFTTLEYQVNENEWAPVMTVVVLPAQMQDPAKVKLDWETVSY